MNDISIKNLEITSTCNYKCPICISPSRKGNMNMEEFYNIVDKNNHLFNEKGVWLHFFGEPLTDPNLINRIRYLRTKGIKTRISTNGSLLTENKWKELAESGLDYIVVSISTLSRETYFKTRGKDNFHLVLNNLLGFKKYVDEFNHQIEIQAVLIDTDNDNGKSREEFTNYFHKLGINAAFHNFTNRANNVELDLFIKNKHDCTITRAVCNELDKVAILSNCEVVTCYCDFEGQNSLGNLKDFDYSLEALMKDGKLEDLKKRLMNQIYTGACETCTDWIYYQSDSKEKYVTVYPAPMNKTNFGK